MILRKKMLMTVLACLIGFQPVAKADFNDLKPMLGLILLCSSPKILLLALLVLKNIGDRGYSGYRTIKHKFGFESSELRKAKNAFMKKLDDLDLDDQCDWQKNCYCHFFSNSANAPTTIENFIAGKEKYDEKNKLKLLGWTLWALNEKEKQLFSGFSEKNLQDEFDKYFFIQDAFALIGQYRKNQVDRFVGVCCAAYPCQYGIETDIKRKYLSIKASLLFKGFRSASDKSVNRDKPDATNLITKDLLFACIEQQNKK